MLNHHLFTLPNHHSLCHIDLPAFGQNIPSSSVARYYIALFIIVWIFKQAYLIRVLHRTITHVILQTIIPIISQLTVFLLQILYPEILSVFLGCLLEQLFKYNENNCSIKFWMIIRSKLSHDFWYKVSNDCWVSFHNSSSKFRKLRGEKMAQSKNIGTKKKKRSTFE